MKTAGHSPFSGFFTSKTAVKKKLDFVDIIFGSHYTVGEKAHRKVVYADKQELEENIIHKHTYCLMVDEDTGEVAEPTTGTGALNTPVVESPRCTVKRRSHLKT